LTFPRPEPERFKGNYYALAVDIFFHEYAHENDENKVVYALTDLAETIPDYADRVLEFAKLNFPPKIHSRLLGDIAEVKDRIDNRAAVEDAFTLKLLNSPIKKSIKKKPLPHQEGVIFFLVDGLQC